MLDKMESLSSNLLLLIVFALLVAGIYRLCSQKGRKYFLLLANLFFYFCCSAKYLVVMLLVGFWSFLAAKRMAAKEHRPRLIVAVGPLVLLLCLFKYWMPLNELIGNAVWFDAIRIVLPLGMSYYILKSISYIVDVREGRIAAEENVVEYLSYVTFFPQIIAGPIQRYKDWRPQLGEWQYRVDFRTGFYYIVQGLFMKVVIANRLSSYVLETFASPAQANGVQLWLGFFLYAFYIYFDFAGYSNIAVGITQCFGIDCVNNFKRPYLSINLKDFWSRWHISLSTWLRDYVYIPLGGNRKGKLRKVVNVMITFLVSGMWHGSTWNFILWGGFHGLLNAPNYKKRELLPKWRVVLQTIVTFMLVSVGWVFFGTKTLKDSLDYLQGMVCRISLDMNSIQAAIMPFSPDRDNTCLPFFLVAVIFIAIFILKEIAVEFGIIKFGKKSTFVWYVFLLAAVILFGVFSNTTFIYAGF